MLVSFNSPVDGHFKTFMVYPSIVKKITIMCICRVTIFPPINSSIVHTFTVLPFSLVKCVLRSFQSSSQRSSSRLFIVIQCCFIWMDHGLFSQSPAEGRAGCFLPSAVTDNVLINCRVHASFQNFGSVSWEEIPRV